MIIIKKKMIIILILKKIKIKNLQFNMNKFYNNKDKTGIIIKNI